MPGKGCLARKAERRAERDKQRMEEGTLPASKMPRVASLAEDGKTPDPAAGERVWATVPPFADLVGEDREKAVKLCHALFEATNEYGDGKVTVSQLGSHFKVAAAKKEPCFSNMRLVDLIKRHSDIFGLIEATGTVTGGWIVKLEPGAAEALPEASTAEEEVDTSDLPERIDDPMGNEKKLQALRIEIVHALSKRGMSAMLHDLGQEPKILKHKTGFLQSKTLLKIMKAFPSNFTLEDKGNGSFSIDLVSLDVSDTSMLADFLSSRDGDEGKGKSKGKGKGKFKGKGVGKGMGVMGKGKMMAMMNAMKGMMASWKGGGDADGWGSG